jgi:asparagine synthase (glutamine-hydrolysing)
MCGIVGQFVIRNLNRYNIQPIKRATKLMENRGPDEEGFWTDDSHCFLGFRRLSIIDLSPNGHQPMCTPDKRFTIVINGEIFNFKKLRRELKEKGWRFRSSGDAEVALFALAEWGKAALDRFNGMFALAFYDQKEKRLLLARDHVGSKPLYYLQNQNGLVFASQFDQIMAHPWAKNLSIDQGALALYLRFGYIPAPYAILETTHLLEAGAWLEATVNKEIRKGQFFKFPKNIEPDLYGREAMDALDSTLKEAVQRQMVSDVPLGTFLSGGIDSPLICSIAQSISNQPIKAFTIGVPKSHLDESKDATQYAIKIGVDHQVDLIHFENIQDLAIEVTNACSEPFGDYSIFPTLLVSKFASKQVKVILSGDGGDELFWGYTGRMGNAIRYANLYKLPFWARKLRWWILRRPNEWNLRYFRTPGEWYQSNHEHNFEGFLKTIFPNLSSFPEDYNQYNYDGNTPDKAAQWVRWNEFTGHMGNGLLKVDRGSMYNSLEVRSPLLDRKVIETGLRIGWRSCIDLENNKGKLLLRKMLEKRVGFTTKGKRGFTVPMDDWLRGPLKAMFEDLVISPGEILGQPIDQHQMRTTFMDHIENRCPRGWGLWIILSLALWEKKQYQRWL